MSTYVLGGIDLRLSQIPFLDIHLNTFHLHFSLCKVIVSFSRRHMDLQAVIACKIYSLLPIFWILVLTLLVVLSLVRFCKPVFSYWSIFASQLSGGKYTEVRAKAKNELWYSCLIGTVNEAQGGKPDTCFLMNSEWNEAAVDHCLELLS